MDPNETYTPWKEPKYCFVPSCKNTSRDTQKAFFAVPNPAKQEWCNAVGASCSKRFMTICEDHLNLEEDMENYRYWITKKVRPRLKCRLPHSLASTSSTASSSFNKKKARKRVQLSNKMGSVSQVRMKPGCLPHKFICQSDRNTRTANTTERPYIDKKRRMMIVKECIKNLERKCIVTHQSSFEGIEFSSSGTMPSNFECQVDRRKRLSDTTMSRTVYIKRLKTDIDEESQTAVNTSNSKQKDDYAMSETAVEVTDEIDYSAEPASSHAKPASSPEHTLSLNEENNCDACTKEITGCLYQCVQCSHRMCGECDAAGEHSHHYVLRVPKHSTQEEMEMVVNRIRGALDGVTLAAPGDVAEESVQVKEEYCLEEPDPLGESGQGPLVKREPPEQHLELGEYTDTQVDLEFMTVKGEPPDDNDASTSTFSLTPASTLTSDRTLTLTSDRSMTLTSDRSMTLTSASTSRHAPSKARKTPNIISASKRPSTAARISNSAKKGRIKNKK